MLAFSFSWGTETAHFPTVNGLVATHTHTVNTLSQVKYFFIAVALLCCLWNREPQLCLMWVSVFPVDGVFTPPEEPQQSIANSRQISCYYHYLFILWIICYRDYRDGGSCDCFKTQSRGLKDLKLRATIYQLFIVSYHKMGDIGPFKWTFFFHLTVNKSPEKTLTLTLTNNVFVCVSKAHFSVP